ncbi:MAG: sugar ABC transporter permease [Faecalibacterium sp.]
MEFAGLGNFIDIFSDSVFRASIWKTFYYTSLTVFFSLIFALLFAVLLNQKMRGRNFFRTAIFFPYVASVVAVGAVWNAILQKDYGPVNEVLRLLGVENPPGWVASVAWAIPAVIIVSVWKNIGYFMMIYIAGLQNIPVPLYEAATIEGANRWVQFWRITLPQLRNTTFFVLMMLTINSFKAFDLIYVMTAGGPGNATTMLAQYIYNQSFIYWNYGRASAASIILFIFVGGITVVQMLVEKKQNDS